MPLQVSTIAGKPIQCSLLRLAPLGENGITGKVGSGARGDCAKPSATTLENFQIRSVFCCAVAVAIALISVNIGSDLSMPWSVLPIAAVAVGG